jgi:hypothetical protein
MMQSRHTTFRLGPVLILHVGAQIGNQCGLRFDDATLLFQSRLLGLQDLRELDYFLIVAFLIVSIEVLLL